MAFCALPAFKSVKQPFFPNSEQLQMMETFRDMVNHCIRIGLEHNCSTMKKLSNLSYQKLKDYPIQIQTDCHIAGGRQAGTDEKRQQKGQRD
jgi:putative transposase